jgi:hypothetical protein
MLENRFKNSQRLAKRSPDAGDSAAFSGFFYTSAESRSQAESTLRPSAGNAHRWAMSMQSSRRTLLI